MNNILKQLNKNGIERASIAIVQYSIPAEFRGFTKQFGKETTDVGLSEVVKQLGLAAKTTGKIQKYLQSYLTKRNCIQIVVELRDPLILVESKNYGSMETNTQVTFPPMLERLLSMQRSIPEEMEF